MKVKVRHIQDFNFEVKAREHTVLCDQPIEKGGSDFGMTPPELLLASLGTCAAYYAFQYLKARSLPDAHLEVSVTAQKGVQPARLNSFRIEVAVPAVAPEHEAGLLRAVNACLIHNTLTYTPAIETVVRTGVSIA